MQKVFINNRLDYQAYSGVLLSAKAIQKELRCSMRTAYRLVRRHGFFLVIDNYNQKSYRAIAYFDFDRIKEWYLKERRGNPRFRDPVYQSELARRPRKRRLTR